MHVALTIAGSDSGGGAGIQADLKTFEAFDVFGTSAITAVTAQNTRGVTAVHVLPPDFVRAQILAVATDLRPAACKTGMLATQEIIETVAATIRDGSTGPCVVDPVMVATSGDRLLDAGAERAIARMMVPLCAVVTPNLHEAAMLTDGVTGDVASMELAARRLVDMGAGAALVKGGHLEGDIVIDVLWDGRTMRRWRHARLVTPGAHGTHGSGCTLSAAIAAGLARGQTLVDATSRAIGYVHHAIAMAPAVGGGSQPLRHRIDPFTIALPAVEED